MQVAIILGADPYRTSAIPEMEELCTKPNAATEYTLWTGDYTFTLVDNPSRATKKAIATAGRISTQRHSSSTRPLVRPPNTSIAHPIAFLAQAVSKVTSSKRTITVAVSIPHRSASTIVARAIGYRGLNIAQDFTTRLKKGWILTKVTLLAWSITPARHGCRSRPYKDTPSAGRLAMYVIVLNSPTRSSSESWRY